MKRIRRAFTTIILLLATAVIIAIGIALKRQEQIALQGVVCCREYSAASKIAGRIEQLYVAEGERVDSGVLLYTLTTPELTTKLEQAVAADRAARALDREVAAGARAEQITAAQSLYNRATAASTLAEKSYNRIRNLYSKGVVTAQQLDEAEANFKAAESQQRAAYAEYSLALAGATKEQKAAAAAKVAIATGAVNEVEVYIADSRVYAPVSGEISTIVHYAGEVVAAGFPVVTLLDTDDIWVEFNIKETLMPTIDIGTIFTAYIPALDKDIRLQVSYIAPQADFAVWHATDADGGFDIRTFVVKMRPTDGSALRRGMSAIVKLPRN